MSNQNEIDGWAYANSLMQIGNEATVQTSYINLRAEPGPRQAKLGRVNQHTKMKIIGPLQRNYLQVRVLTKEVRGPGSERLPTPDGSGNSSSASITEFGIHNENGAQWMLENGVKGWSLHTVALGSNSTRIDHSRFKNAGIKMLVRLNYAYYPNGNMPLTGHPDYENYIHACIQTMKDSVGVWGFVLGNETNHPHEFPHNQPITAREYIDLYNRVWQGKSAEVSIAPQAIDPYNATFEPRNYWIEILNGIIGANFLTIHAKTQDSNPNNIDSAVKFSHNPLKWQFYHLRAYQPLLKAVPGRFQHLPVIGTEINPQRKSIDGNGNGPNGWKVTEGAEWVRRAAKHFNAYNRTTSQKVIGVIFYRFSDDNWAISNHGSTLDAIKEVS